MRLRFLAARLWRPVSACATPHRGGLRCAVQFVPGGRGGLIDLLDQYPVGLAVLSRSDYWQQSDTNARLLEALRRRGVPLRYVQAGDRFGWGRASWRILGPPAGRFTASGNEANASIVYLLRTRGSDLLFTGDIEHEAEQALLASFELEPVDVFLVTHHGSNHASSTALLDEIQPRYSVISAGARNRYRHPGLAAIERLQTAGTTIWCTAANGDLTLTLRSGGRTAWDGERQDQPSWQPAANDPEGVQTGRCAGR